ncbi:UNVERIFIED_CONTAM: hypothetical protein FKN15_014198 [Acipenser sinensis]
MIGAATSAARAGVNQHLIKTMGRWSSSAVEAYISLSATRSAKRAKHSRQAQMAQVLEYLASQQAQAPAPALT